MNAASDLIITLPGGIPMEFCRIPRSPETGFRMGARGELSREEPIHRVVIPLEFYLGRFVVTQEQYAAVAREVPELQGQIDPSSFTGARWPVEMVNWTEANRFCKWLTVNLLSKDFVASGFTRFCLPTEAEWEYACRGGSETEYYNGDGEAALAEVAWYDANSGGATHPVDEKPERHPFGLFGMHGNVLEWCHDLFQPDAYRIRGDGGSDPGAVLRDTEWCAGLDRLIQGDRFRVMRGGSWSVTAGGCRSAYRLGWGPDVRDTDFGFRVCLVRGPASEGGARELEQDAKAAAAPEVGSGGTTLETPGAAGAGATGVEAGIDFSHESFPRGAGLISPFRVERPTDESSPHENPS